MPGKPGPLAPVPFERALPVTRIGIGLPAPDRVRQVRHARTGCGAVPVDVGGGQAVDVDGVARPRSSWQTVSSPAASGDPATRTAAGYPRPVPEHPITAYERVHLEGCLRLFEAEGWHTYTDDPERTHRAFTAPGSTTLVVLVDGTVVAICQLQSDGHVQAHLSTLAVASEHRRLGIALELLREALERAGGLRIDLISYFDPFYEAVASRRFSGFRITREDLARLPQSRRMPSPPPSG
jgi:GNAT superfamily N-acetyltransferase